MRNEFALLLPMILASELTGWASAAFGRSPATSFEMINHPSFTMSTRARSHSLSSCVQTSCTLERPMVIKRLMMSTLEWESDGSLVSESFNERYSGYLPSPLLQKASDCGWTHPTRIQQVALDAILRDQVDVVLQAETGSGKTLAYLLPCLANVDPRRSAVQALIVVPTRELGLQVARVAKRLASSSTPDKIMIMTVLQGSQNRRQRAWAWAEPPHIVIGTPQELCDMIRWGGIKRYNSVNLVVVDEVDACLLNNAGSMAVNLQSSTLHELLSKYLSPTYSTGSDDDGDASALAAQSMKAPSKRPVSQQRQTIFCSATIPQPRHFLKQCVQNKWMLRDPKHVCLRPGEQHVPPTLEHVYLVCASQELKIVSLRRVMKKILQSSTVKQKWQHRKVLIFADPQRPMAELAAILANDLKGVYWTEGSVESTASPAIVSVLSLEDTLSGRAAAMDIFRSSNVPPALRILLSSDLAARGLDIADISLVIHLDLPIDADTYLHRAGRAGRFGRKGQVLSIVPPEQEFVLQRLINKLGVTVKCIGRQPNVVVDATPKE